MKSYLYLVTCSAWQNETHNIYKFGYTTDPISRLQVIKTCIPHSMKIVRLWSIKTIPACYKEQEEHDNALDLFIHKEQCDIIKKYEGIQGGTEFYIVENPDLIREIYERNGYILKEKNLDEVEEKVMKTKSSKKEGWVDLYKKFGELTLFEPELPDLEIFIQRMLDGKSLRGQQQELWDIMLEKCRNNSDANGLIQWPTASGKTVGIHIMLVFALYILKYRKTSLKALVIAPKNDILETLAGQFSKLLKYDIEVLKGYGGELANVDLSRYKNTSYVLLATHQGLMSKQGDTKKTYMETLPKFNFVLYDEAHRITGDMMLETMKKIVLEQWQPAFFLGTSATPYTSNREQQSRLKELFGDPLNMLHTCTYSQAFQNKWIAQQKFGVFISNKNATYSQKVMLILQKIMEEVERREVINKFRGRKIIAYFPSTRNDMKKAAEIFRENAPSNYKIYIADDSDSADQFCNAESDGDTVHILVACQKYREGSDIRGLEFTATMVGQHIEIHILLQIAGRSLRLDYEGKMGGTLLFYSGDDTMDPDMVWKDLFNQIVYEYALLERRVGEDGNPKPPSKAELKALAEMLMSSVEINGQTLSIEESSIILEKMYQREFYQREKKIKYIDVVSENKRLQISCTEEYKTLRIQTEHACYIDDPHTTFKDEWTTWCDFLGVDTTKYPATMEEFKQSCMDKDITDYSKYMEYVETHDDMPKYPTQMYSKFTNWEDCFPEESTW